LPKKEKKRRSYKAVEMTAK